MPPFQKKFRKTQLKLWKSPSSRAKRWTHQGRFQFREQTSLNTFFMSQIQNTTQKQLDEALKIPKFYSSNPNMFHGPYNNAHEQLLFTCHISFYICKKQGTAQIWNSEFLFGYSF